MPASRDFAMSMRRRRRSHSRRRTRHRSARRRICRGRANRARRPRTRAGEMLGRPDILAAVRIDAVTDDDQRAGFAAGRKERKKILRPPVPSNVSSRAACAIALLCPNLGCQATARQRTANRKVIKRGYLCGMLPALALPWHPPRPVRGRVAPRQRRHGRGVSRPRHPAAPRCRAEAAAGAVAADPSGWRASARGAGARRAESPKHRRDLRHRGVGRDAPRSSSSWSKDRRSRSGSRRGRSRSTKRWRSRGRSPTRSRPRTSRASSTAT